MNEIRKRNLAGFISLVCTIGCLGIITITIMASTFKEFMEIIPTSPQLIFALGSGVVSLAIGSILLAPVELGKNFFITSLLISITILVLAVAQKSIILLFVLFWPWSLYKVYKSETA